MIRLTEWTSEQMIFIDESTANERTMDRKFQWSPVGTSAIHVQPLKWSEKWSILPVYTIEGFIAWDIVQGSYNIELFNEFVRNWIIPSTNSFLELHSVLMMNNARIHRSKVHIISFLD